MKSIFCIGHTTYDTFLKLENVESHCDVNHTECKISFDFGSKIPVNEIHYGVGGSAANVAVGSSKMGLKVDIFTMVGNDMRGMEILNALKKNEIGLFYFKTDSFPTNQSAILSYANDRTIFSYHHDRLYSLKNINIFHDYLFIGSIGNNIDSLYSEAIVVKKLNNEKKLFYNPGGREIKNERESVLKLLEYTDYLIVNYEEACSILDPTLTRQHITFEDLAKLLLDKGPKTIIITDAEKGVQSYDGERFCFVEAKKVKVVEKTGAGDAFTSGFIGAIASGQKIERAIEWGVFNSASVIQSFGAQNGLLTLEEIQTHPF
jgi:sugar/nucleoside kinase (ribokinase family)